MPRRRPVAHNRGLHPGSTFAHPATPSMSSHQAVYRLAGLPGSHGLILISAPRLSRCLHHHKPGAWGQAAGRPKRRPSTPTAMLALAAKSSGISAGQRLFSLAPSVGGYPAPDGALPRSQVMQLCEPKLATPNSVSDIWDCPRSQQCPLSGPIRRIYAHLEFYRL